MKARLQDAPRVIGDAQRLRLVIRGAVQGVGFRPFVFRLAGKLGLTGWINNSPQGVFIEVEGPRDCLEQFLLGMDVEKPPRSFIQSLETSWLDLAGYAGFEIRESQIQGAKTALVLPDIATCADCLSEIQDPADRRYRYPFTNCTNCGPRFSIIEALPYDRANTSMKAFTMCSQCQGEYMDPGNRRFHAQPNACPVCGPQLQLWDKAGAHLEAPVPTARAVGDEALHLAADAIRRGQIVAVKGIGGFHLMVDARNEASVLKLRERKHREEKPFALLFPSLDLLKTCCEVSTLEERLLCSAEAPIVLLDKLRQNLLVASSVAPRNSTLGIMLPSNPLHHLLMTELDFPIVATSGNLSDEPICTREQEAFLRLASIADLFLVHTRPIVRHVDDSIVRVLLDREMVLRRARGYAPLPVSLPPAKTQITQTILAVGAHLKNSVALAVGDQAFISQHIGDLETEPAYTAFRTVISDLEKLYDATPETLAADLHPDYLSTQFAHATGKPVTNVQHHVAHVLSCMAENEVAEPFLGVSWDGTGLGLDGTVWGGEFFLVTPENVLRVAHFRPFPLPGGDQAVREPRRSALGLLYQVLGKDAFEQDAPAIARAFSKPEFTILETMLSRGINSPPTSSVGRLFDAVACITGLRDKTRFEGQAAMELEFALNSIVTEEAYEIPITPSDGECELNWEPMVRTLLADLNERVPLGVISAKFHNALVEAVVAVAKKFGERRVILSGGCFQNRYLLERAVQRLNTEQFLPYWHQRVPPNDGGIALGQIVAARRTMQ